MSAKIEKYITTKADFDAGIAKFLMTPENVDGLITMKADRQDKAALNSLWTPITLGAGSWVNYCNGNRSIQLLRPTGAGNNVALEGPILPDTYDIFFKFKINSAMGDWKQYFVGGIGRWDAAGAGATQMCKVGICILYATREIHFWKIKNGTPNNFYEFDGASMTWRDSVLSYYGSLGAGVDVGYARIQKTTTTWILSVYDTSKTLISSVSIAISGLYDTTYHDRFYSGDIYDVNIVQARDWELIDIYGIFVDRYTDKPGRFAAILDLGRRPVIPGSYTEILLPNWFDEEYAAENANANIGFRSGPAVEKVAQGFKLKEAGIIDIARIVFYEYACTTEVIWLEIWSDDGTGKPNALIPGYISNTVLVASVGTPGDFSWTEFLFASAITSLNKNTQYHIVVQSDMALGGQINIRYDNTGTYPDGQVYFYNSLTTTWYSLSAVYDFVFGIRLKETILITRKISYSDNADFKTLSSKADFDGNNAVSSQIDTATLPGAVTLALDPGNPPYYYLNGYIQNDIDLGRTPTEYCTFYADYFLGPVFSALTLVFKFATSDDGSTWTGFTAKTLTAHTADLTSLGKHRYWRVKIEFGNAFDISPILYNWTIDAFSPLIEFNKRDKIQKSRYIKLQMDFETNNPMTSIELTEILFEFLIAYELYIKRVKYKIDAGGITADMELSSQ